jgi:hypothetical protein
MVSKATITKKNLRWSPLRIPPNQGPARQPMRGRLEAHFDHLNIWGEVGGDCLGKAII